MKVPAKKTKAFLNIFQNLTLKEQRILTLRYVNKMSLAEIGNELSVTRERIRQVLLVAERKISQE